MPSSTQKPNLTGALAWSSDGNVGIGTNAPGRKLDVEGDGRFVQVQAATTGAITLRQNIGDTVGGHIQWVNNANIVEKGWLAVDTSSNMIFATQSAERLRIDSNGKVGVGTISDVAVVDIAGDGVSVGTPATVGGPQLRVSQASPTGYGGIQFGKTPTPSTSLGWHLVSELSGSFHFYSGTWGYGQYRVGISAAGNVGIGVVAPSSKLDVAGDITLGADFSGTGAQQLIFRGANTDYAKIRFESAGDAAGQSGLIFETWDNANEPFVFRQSNVERLRIDTNGNVGIGTQFPSQRLTVAGTVESTSGGFKFPDGTVQTTAASLATGFAVSAQTNGYQRLPSGLILQWCTGGAHNTESDITVTFPIAFPNTCLNVMLGTQEPSGGRDAMYQLRSFNNTSCVARLNQFNNSGGTAYALVWAIGY